MPNFFPHPQGVAGARDPDGGTSCPESALGPGRSTDAQAAPGVFWQHASSHPGRFPHRGVATHWGSGSAPMTVCVAHSLIQTNKQQSTERMNPRLDNIISWVAASVVVTLGVIFALRNQKDQRALKPVRVLP